MGSIGIGLLVVVCLFGGLFGGMWLQRALPERRLSEDSRHLIEISLGIVGTMAGVVLGLLLASATNAWDNLENQVKATSGNVLQLDRILSRYGPAANDARATLRYDIAQALAHTLHDNSAIAESDVPRRVSNTDLLGQVAALVPKNETQTALKPEAVRAAIALGQVRWLLVEEFGSSIKTPLLVLMIFWFSITFLGLGLVAPTNKLVITAMGLSALAIAGAVFIMVALYDPFHGIFHISSASLHDALTMLGK